MEQEIKSKILEIAILEEIDFIKTDIKNDKIIYNICRIFEIPLLRIMISIISFEGKFIVEISTENNKSDIKEEFRNLKYAKKYCLEYLLNI